LVETLNAVLSQQDQDLELIVVDDFSSDDSRSLLISFKEKHPEIVLVFLKENLGESNAVNVGWSLATKQFVSIVNSDDPPHKSWLSEMATGIELNPGFGFYYPNRLVIDKNGEICRKDVLKDWSTRALYEKLVPIASAGTIINRMQLPSNFVPRDINVNFPSDLIQMFRLGLLVEGKRIRYAWGTWREHKNSISGSNSGPDLAYGFEINVSTWLKQNEDQIKHLSRKSFREFYFYAHIFLLLIRHVGLKEALVSIDKKVILLKFLRDPPTFFVWASLLLSNLLKQLQRYAKIFLKSNILK
jgi:glycosyltransferase involved in cell wall biosynthesis